MTRKPTVTPGRPAAELTPERMRTGIERIGLRIADLEKFDTSSISQRADPRILALEKSIEETLQRVFGAGTIEEQRYSSAARLHQQMVAMSSSFGRGPSGPSPHQIQNEFNDFRAKSIASLSQAIKGLEEDLSHNGPSFMEEIEDIVTVAPKVHTRKVFIVHGHDEGAREAVARFLERIGFEPVILHERANQGRTVIEKVEAHSDVGFAVVLLTPDDVGCLRGETPQPRARQNVLLELGFFIGKLTRKHVCTLKVGELEIPSDWRGVVDEPYDTNGAWKQTLARELKAVGYEIDWNKVMQ
jgi:predicted nucleotide-binding protein